MDADHVQTCIEKCVANADAVSASWGRVSTRFEPTDEFRSLLNLDQVIELIWCGVVPFPYIRLVADEGQDPGPLETCEERFAVYQRVNGVVSARRILSGFERGMTIFVSHLDQFVPSIRRFAETLARTTRAPVGVHAILSPPGAAALPSHQDEFHALVVQAHGSKNWTVDRDTSESSMRAGIEQVRDGSTVEMVPGNGLYVPAGLPHKVIGAPGVGSLHFELSVYERRLGELSLLLDRLRGQNRLLMDDSDDDVSFARGLLASIKSTDQSETFSLRQRSFWAGCDLSETDVRASMLKSLADPNVGS